MNYTDFYKLFRFCFNGGPERERVLQELNKSQWFSRETLLDLSLERIKSVVRYAGENVPYYQKLFHSLDIHPEDIKTFNDFQQLPFLTKEDVVEHRDEMVSVKFDKSKLHTRETGGSTGLPMPFYIDDTFWWWASAMDLRAQSWYGIKDGCKIAWIWGAQGDMQRNTLKSRLRAEIMRHRYLNALHLTGPNMQAFSEMLTKWHPDMFVAYISSMTIFAQYVRDHNIKGIHPRLIVTTSEKVTPPQRKIIEEVFDCPLADNYSSRELAQLGYECPHGSMHISEGNYLELIADDKPVPAGEKGEVVITSLFRYSMPFIRYRLSDLAIESPSSCTCGRGLPVLQEIVGRTSDVIVTGNGQYTDEAYFEFFFQGMPQICRYQIHQFDLQHLQVNLVLRQKVDSDWLEMLRKRLQKPFGPDVNVDLKIVDKVELTSNGKFRVISSDLKTGVIR